MENDEIIIIYEEHNGRTGAKSRWRFDPPPITEPRFWGGGTHRKYLIIVKRGTIATLRRVSNRGNVRFKKIVIEKPMYLDFFGGTKDIHQNELEMLKSELKHSH